LEFVLYTADCKHLVTHDVTAYLATQAQMERVCDTKTPQGIAAVGHIKQNNNNEANRILILDNLQDPGNTGTLIRCAEACGFGRVIVCGGAYPWAPKCVRATMGSILRVEVSNYFEFDYIDGYEFWAACLGGEDAWQINKIPDKLALVIGSEARGVSEKFLANAKKIALPMAGEVESLNAAMAGAVIMYKIFRGA
ncbi:MAG: RNA methyltransferase, partial [Clostridia bacterium]|nr:RNA methyltransferase [Clostridia bacterium]